MFVSIIIPMRNEKKPVKKGCNRKCESEKLLKVYENITNGGFE